MAHHHLRLLAVAVVTLTIASCAFSDEGGVDYRKAEPTSVDARTRAAAPAKEPRAAPDPRIVTSLVRKDIEIQDATIRKGDKISVRLRDGYLAECTEWLRNPIRKFKKNCEIAIVFKAFELGHGKGQDFDFSPNAVRDGRLVYYSNDVEPGQFFNLHNMPVYGPLDYSGRPFGIDIYIIEIDTEDAAAESLLQTLAGVGATAFPPAQPVLMVLEKLGGALLHGGTDDIGFRYSMVLDPEGGYQGMAYARLEAGTYALVREQERGNNTDWNSLVLDDNTGRLWKVGANGEKSPYRDNSYLTVQINRNAGSDEVQLSQNTYGAFRDVLERDATDKAEALSTALTPALQRLALDRVQIRNFSRARVWLEDLLGVKKENGAWQITEHASRSGFQLFSLIKHSIDQLKVAPTGTTCASRLAATIAAANPPPTKPPESDLSAEQIDSLLDKLSRKSGATQTTELEHESRVLNRKGIPLGPDS